MGIIIILVVMLTHNRTAFKKGTCSSIFTFDQNHRYPLKHPSYLDNDFYPFNFDIFEIVMAINYKIKRVKIMKMLKLKGKIS